MVDEVEFKETLRKLDLRDCAFAKAILNNQCLCEYSHRTMLAGREIAVCRHEATSGQCQQLHGLLREAASFALKVRATGKLPHGKAIRVQTGGLKGLQDAMEPDKASERVENIAGLIRQAMATYQSMDDFPWQEIVQSIAHTRGRRH